MKQMNYFYFILRSKTRQKKNISKMFAQINNVNFCLSQPGVSAMSQLWQKQMKFWKFWKIRKITIIITYSRFSNLLLGISLLTLTSQTGPFLKEEFDQRKTLKINCILCTFSGFWKAIYWFHTGRIIKKYKHLLKYK